MVVEVMAWEVRGLEFGLKSALQGSAGIWSILLVWLSGQGALRRFRLCFLGFFPVKDAWYS